MGMFDNEDEEYQTAKPEQGPPAPNVRDYLLNKYKLAMADNSEIDAASADAAKRNMVTTIAQGISKFLAPKHTNDSAYAAMQAQNNQLVADARKKKQERVESLLTEDKLQQQQVDRERATTRFNQDTTKFETDQAYAKEDHANKSEKHGWDRSAHRIEAARNNPNDPRAVAARGILAKKYGWEPEILNGLSYEDMLEMGRQAASGGATRLQQVNLEVPGKGIVKGVFDPSTGKITPAEINGETVYAGLKPTISATTGERISATNFAAPAQQIISSDGKTPLADVMVSQAGKVSEARATGVQQAKDNQAVETAMAGGDKFRALRKHWGELYDKASKEGPLGSNTGPGFAQVAKAGNSMGFDVGQATAQLLAESQREASNYLREQSGLTVTDAEYKRLMDAFPQLGSDKGKWDAAMDAWQMDADRTIDAALARAGKPPRSKGATTAAAKTEAQPKAAKTYTSEQEATISQYMKQYPGKSREEIITQMNNQGLLK